jgi:hypothetical protein
MFTADFEKHYQDAVKKLEQTFEHVKQANEFWVNAILSSYKTFYSTKK